MRRWVGCAGSMLLLGLSAARAGAQQASATLTPLGATASRQELDSALARAQSADTASFAAAQREALRSYTAEVQSRLRDGDFQPGDRILLVVAGDSALSDTFTVQPGRLLAVPKLPAIPLTGVLRSELQPYLAGRLHEYVRDTLLRASPLVRIGVLGEVAHPGYYRVPLQITLGDALMFAGGPAPTADLTRLTIRRGNGTLLAARAARDAMVRGIPLSRLGLDAGDELVVVGAPGHNWPLIAQIGGVATGLVLSLHALNIF